MKSKPDWSKILPQMPTGRREGALIFFPVHRWSDLCSHARRVSYQASHRRKLSHFGSSVHPTDLLALDVARVK
jgi:hypothetical protein